MALNATAHIVFRLTGNRRKAALFHAILGMRDKDYPLTRNKPIACSRCKGFSWHNPLMNIAEVKALARQINDDTEVGGHLTVKIHQWITQAKCEMNYGNSNTITL